MGFKSRALGNQQRFSCFPNTVSVRFYQFQGNEFYIVDGMSRKTKMIGNSGGLINVMSLDGFLDCAISFSHSQISFLDVNVLLINGRLETDLYVKPTDKHQYLLKSSCHPSHTKQSIPFSMALRLRRICSTDEFFNTRSDALTTHLIKRGYPHRFIKEEIEKVRHIPRSKALETSMKNQSNRIPFVVTFNPALPNIRRIIFNNLNISFFTAMQSSISFSSSHIISPMQQPT